MLQKVLADQPELLDLKMGHSEQNITLPAVEQLSSDESVEAFEALVRAVQASTAAGNEICQDGQKDGAALVSD